MILPILLASLPENYDIYNLSSKIRFVTSSWAAMRSLRSSELATLVWYEFQRKIWGWDLWGSMGISPKYGEGTRKHVHNMGSYQDIYHQPHETCLKLGKNAPTLPWNHWESNEESMDFTGWNGWNMSPLGWFLLATRKIFGGWSSWGRSPNESRCENQEWK